MKVLGLIPARGGSKGVPGKNKKLLAGKPLIVHTIEAAKPSLLAKTIVSTDDLVIANLSRLAGVEVPFIRPENLASDTAKSIDVAKHALLIMEEKDGEYDAVMILQPTAPFRTTQDIDAAIRLMEANPLSDSVISVVDVGGHHPARMKYIQDGKLIDPPFAEQYESQNRQELSPVYIRNGAIYLTKRETLLHNSFKGQTCVAYVMPNDRSANIDTIHDFDYAEWVYERYLSKE
jgi:CMP-N,N'-diacetyllegionaminic acid synthase